MYKKDLLKGIYVGDVEAHTEQIYLEENKIEPDDFFVIPEVLKEIQEGEIDLIVGMKGAGKSNLFLHFAKETSKSTVVAELDLNKHMTVWSSFERAAKDTDYGALRDLWWGLLAFAVLKAVHKEPGWKVDPVVNHAFRTYGLAPSRSPDGRGKIGFTSKPGPNEKDFPDLVRHPQEVLRRLNDLAKKKKKRIWILLDNVENAVNHKELESLVLVIEALVNDVYLKGIKNVFARISLKIFSRTDIYLSIGGWEKFKIVDKYRSLVWSHEQVARLLLKRLLSNSAVRRLVSRYRLRPLKKPVTPESELSPQLVDGLAGEELEHLFDLIFPPYHPAGKSRGGLYEHLKDSLSDGYHNSIQPRLAVFWMQRVKVYELERTGKIDEAQLPLFSESAIRKAFKDVSEFSAGQGWVYDHLQAHRELLIKEEKTKLTRSELVELFEGLPLKNPISILWTVGILRPLNTENGRPEAAQEFEVPTLFRYGLWPGRGAEDNNSRRSTRKRSRGARVT